MWLIVSWIGLSVVVGAFAAARERHPIAWGLLAILISPPLAFVFLLAAGEKRPNRCPACRERVKADATICPHCRNAIPPQPAEPARYPSGSAWR